MANLTSKANRGQWSPQQAKEFPSDAAVFEAAKTLQACWEYVWDVCDVCEMRMRLSEKEEEAAALASDETGDVFGDFFGSAVGFRVGRPQVRPQG